MTFIVPIFMVVRLTFVEISIAKSANDCHFDSPNEQRNPSKIGSEIMKTNANTAQKIRAAPLLFVV